MTSEGIKDNKVFTKFVEYDTIFSSFGSEELLGNKEQPKPAENTCIKATFELFAVALRK